MCVIIHPFNIGGFTSKVRGAPLTQLHSMIRSVLSDDATPSQTSTAPGLVRMLIHYSHMLTELVGTIHTRSDNL